MYKCALLLVTLLAFTNVALAGKNCYAPLDREIEDETGVFLVTGIVTNIKFGLAKHHGLFVSGSRYEAEGVFLDVIRCLRPESDGWRHHSVSVIEMSEEKLINLSDNARSEDDIKK